MQILASTTLAVLASLACASSRAQDEQDKPDAAKPEAAARTFDHSHADWALVLKAHAKDDGFDYRALKGDRSKLDAYLKSLEAVTAEELGGWTREQQYAFWINAYNAYTVQRVVDNYPIDSIKSIGSLFTTVWDQKFIPMKGLHPEGKDEKLTLNDIEHKILRPKFQDARVHAAVNCASKGCPPLATEAFTAEKLDAQLDRQVAAWLADPARNKYDQSKKKIEVSQIFDWFKDDFVRDAGSVQAWIAKYAPEKEREWIASAKDLKIAHLDYSWSLNDARAAPAK